MPDTETKALALFQPADVETVANSISAWMDSDEVAEIEGTRENILVGTTNMKAITSPAARDIVVAAWESLRLLVKRTETHFEQATSPLNRFHKMVTAERAKIIQPMQAEADRLGALASKWDREQEALRLAEQRRLEDEQRRAAKAERERLAKSKQAAGGSSAEVETTRTDSLPLGTATDPPAAPPPPTDAPPPLVTPAAPATGPKHRANYKAQILDMHAWLEALVKDNRPDNPVEPRYPLPEALLGLKVNVRGHYSTPWLNNQAKSSGGKFNMPGVETYDDGKLAGAGRKR